MSPPAAEPYDPHPSSTATSLNLQRHMAGSMFDSRAVPFVSTSHPPTPSLAKLKLAQPMLLLKHRKGPPRHFMDVLAQDPHPPNPPPPPRGGGADRARGLKGEQKKPKII